MVLYIMCGLPNSGKTTKVKKMLDLYDAVIVSHDEERIRLYTPFCPIAEIEDKILKKIKGLLLSGKSVIYDTLALSIAERRQIIEACWIPGLKVICIFMDTPLDIIRRRGMIMPSEWLEPPTENEGFELIVCHDGY